MSFKRKTLAEVATKINNGEKPLKQKNDHASKTKYTFLPLYLFQNKQARHSTIHLCPSDTRSFTNEKVDVNDFLSIQI